MAETPFNPIPHDWERFRAYLRVLAGVALDQQLKAKLDPSDIVQQTLLQGFRALDDFRGTSEGEMMGWLRQILIRNIGHAVRDYHREKRDINRELSIRQIVESTVIRAESILAIDGPSPEEQVLKSEQVLCLYAAIDTLPVGQRTAVELHYLQGRKISEVAAEMEQSASAVAGLIKRGLKKLRTTMRRPSEGGAR